MNVSLFFISFWPTYTVIVWWFLHAHTFDELLALLAHMGVIMGVTALFTQSIFDGWDILKDYNLL